jgi:hypothetical protein
MIVKPDTVLGWRRQGFRLCWCWKSRSRKPGRPRINEEIRRLIRRMCCENPTWGAPRIESELRLLGTGVVWDFQRLADAKRHRAEKNSRSPLSPRYLKCYTMFVWRCKGSSSFSFLLDSSSPVALLRLAAGVSLIAVDLTVPPVRPSRQIAAGPVTVP